MPKSKTPTNSDPVEPPDERLDRLDATLTRIEALVAELTDDDDEDRAERLDCLDSDTVALQAAVEYLLGQTSTFRYAIGGLLQRVCHFGPYEGWPQEPTDPWANHVFQELYPVELDGSTHQGPLVPWRSPTRLWRAYGGRSRVREAAKAHGVKTPSGWTVQDIARALLRAGVMPDGEKANAWSS